MLDLVCKSQRGGVFFYKKNELVVFRTVSQAEWSSAVQMRYITFTAFYSFDSVMLRKNESTGVCFSQSVNMMLLQNPYGFLCLAWQKKPQERFYACNRETDIAGHRVCSICLTIPLDLLSVHASLGQTLDTRSLWILISRVPGCLLLPMLHLPQGSSLFQAGPAASPHRTGEVNVAHLSVMRLTWLPSLKWC